MSYSHRLTVSLLGLTLVLCLAGCATTKPDWNRQVGTATFDSLVLEMGPPDKQARLQDGSIVAEWITQRGMTSTTAIGTGYYHSRAYYAPMDATYIQTTSPDYLVRLTFDPAGMLRAWKTLRR